MKARTALIALLKESRDWRRFYKEGCETSALRLRSQTWQFRDELLVRGHALEREEIEDSLFGLARELFPESPAASWGDWAALVVDDALARIQEHFAGLTAEEKERLDFSGAWVENDAIVEAGVAEDRAAFREAVRSYERRAFEALWGAKESAGGSLFGDETGVA
jgi:hypothetical protein